jgi:hypothetical protein
MLVTFAGSALQIPVAHLQMTGALPAADHLWYGLFRLGVGVVELALVVCESRPCGRKARPG